ncbi:RNA 2',3'-cyclic phosphodiesterase [Sphingomonas sp. DG1-23]|uniref:RNA 2',3'-cyclic phosphodiesterase n=1 Tax=Sphingomonas sp. DG1-23 TaxID=3068316 RepID=UPI00273DFD18|nr:RNA 2',3'-cyclic phosphodiesterase [Sphingomonas sp. DG1-23]MDP5279260.1 RNA 2',3'-cyclic phosphodiesterase [Sphingomonas sp. DG1-23]
MHRLFVGLRPPPTIRAQLLALMGGVSGARWQDDAQLHLTLRFIGEVERPQAEDVAIALSNVHFPPIEVSLDGVGEFDKRGRPNALWAGIRPHDALAGLHKKIDQALVRCGLAPEGRAYLPHVTLARMNASAGATARFLESHAGLVSPLFTLDHFLLFESTLGSESAVYETIERYPLRG